MEEDNEEVALAENEVHDPVLQVNEENIDLKQIPKPVINCGTY
jgi:hypothetical protein